MNFREWHIEYMKRHINDSLTVYQLIAAAWEARGRLDNNQCPLCGLPLLENGQCPDYGPLEHK